MLWVNDELSYDMFIPKSDRLHQVWVNAEFDGEINSWLSVPLPTYEALKTSDSRIVNTCIADWGGDHLLTVGEKRLTKRGYHVSPEFLEMFEFSLQEGDASQVLDEIHSIVITQSLSEALFDGQDPINKTIKVDNAGTMKVTGVLQDLPNNSSFEFDYLLTWEYNASVNEWVSGNKTNWGDYSYQVYTELANPEDHLAAQAGIENVLTENGEDDMPRKLFLHPMSQWRLHSDFENGVATGGMRDYIQLFSIIAIFILAMACINFMNLATARSEKRAKEVGIRKSLGTTKSSLIFQFLGESIFITLLAFGLAIFLTLLVLPSYNELVDKKLFIDFNSSTFWILSMMTVLITGVVAGSYPAFYLSSFKPINTLKGTVNIGKGVSTPRKILVILQFGFAIFLMVGTIVIYKQIQLAKSRDLGYDQKNLITIWDTKDIQNKWDVIKLELQQSGAIASATRSNSPITQVWSNNFLGWPDKPDELKVIFSTLRVDYDYTSTMGINLIQGRDFSKEFATDSMSIMVNETGLALMGLENPIGTNLDLWGMKLKLIGVFEDVLMRSPNHDIKPAFAIFRPGSINAITLRVSENGELKENLAAIESIFQKHNPAYPFEFEFVDQEFQEKFQAINMTSSLANIFSILAIVITGLGLFGLASYTTEQRSKEIGVRKVLGASEISIMMLISKDFSKLVMIAFVIVAPLAWYLSDLYLDRYPIRAIVEWWIFPLVGIVAMIFSQAIIINQARVAAIANPVESLKDE